MTRRAENALREYVARAVRDRGSSKVSTTDDGGCTVVTPAVTMSGLEVHREITVPNTGNEDFARTVEVFHNPTGSVITTSVRIVGNLGSDAATTVSTTTRNGCWPARQAARR
jgi:hypothetical protein